MDKHLYSIIKEVYAKYGKEHSMTITSVSNLSKFFKSANDYPEIGEVLEQGFDVNIDELVSLIHPEGFEFETQDLGNIGVEK